MDLSPAAPIFVISHEFHPTKGGIATFTEEMALAAHKLGRSIEVWAPQSSESDDQRFPFPVRRLELKGSQDLACQLRLMRELVAQRRRLRHAIVYLSDPGPVLAMCYLHFFKTFKPGKLVITFHGSEIQSFAAHPAKRFAVAQLIKKADRLSAPSNFTHNLLVQRFPDAACKTFLTPGALRSEFAAASPNGRVNRSRKVHILTVGRLHPRKGQTFTLEALAALPRAQRRRICLSLVGTGSKFDYENRLRERAAQLDFEVRFHGDIANEDLEALYESADIFAMTSVNFRRSVEGFGLVYLEAAAHGLPIVAHRVGGVAEAVSHGENGLLVEPENQTELTAAFSRLIQDPALRQRLGRNGRQWARRNCWLQSADLLFNRWDIAIDPNGEIANAEPRDDTAALVSPQPA